MRQWPGIFHSARKSLASSAGSSHKAAKAKTLAEALEIAYLGAGDISCAPDCKEGVNAFLEKRKPNFAEIAGIVGSL